MRALAILALLVGLGSRAVADPAPPGRDFVVVIDRAMEFEKLAVVTKAVADSLADFDEADRFAVIAFAGTARVVVPLQYVKAPARIGARIAAIESAQSSNLRAGLQSALDVLAPSKKRPMHVVVITNGDSQLGIEKVRLKLHSRGATLSALGFQSLNHATLAKIVDGRGEQNVAETGAQVARILIAQRGPGLEREDQAFVFVIDRSGSMNEGRLDAAKDLVRSWAALLSPDDMLAVVAFDADPVEVVRPQRAKNRMRIDADIARVTHGVEYGTNMFFALKRAHMILELINAGKKHVVVLSDGDDISDGVEALVTDMFAAKITVSAIALKSADRTSMSSIAAAGHGRLYVVDDLSSLPRPFLRETSISRP